MTLGEFIKKRKEELKLKWKDFEDAGVSSQTISCIINNKQKSIMPATREKLATVLKCSQGDIQACMAEVPNPLREEAERPEGNAGISIIAKPKKKPKPEAPAPNPEDEQPKIKAELLVHSNSAGRRALLQELKDLLVQASAEMTLGEERLDDMYAAFGWAVARLIAAEDAAYREAEK